MTQVRLLLADGHLNLLQGVHDLLEPLFDVIVMVADEGSLVDSIERVRPDLVIVDLSLPGAEGANVVRRLRSRYPGVAIIVLSVHDEPTVASRMLEAGVAGFVLKRDAATSLLPAIQEVLRGGTYVCPAVRGALQRSQAVDDGDRGASR
jgi:DNA-binding NarL/FixJ family response regulator